MTTYAMLAAALLAQAPAQAGQLTSPPAAAPAPQGAARPAPPTSSATTPAPRAGEAPVPPGALTLQDALQEALARNPDLKVLAQRVNQSKELSWKAWSNYLPRVVAGGSFTHYNIPDVTFTAPTGYTIRDVGTPSATPNPPVGTPTTLALVPTDVESFVIQKQDQLGAQVVADQALVAPQAIFGIASAAAATRATQDQIESSRRDVLFGVAQVFYTAAGARQAVTVAERLLALNLEREKDARVRYQAGTTPKVALLRAEIDRAGAEQDLKRAQNVYASARVTLAALIDRPDPSFEVVMPPPVPQLPPGAELEARALEQRPDVQAAREQVSYAERTRNGAWARFAPNLGAFARWQWANVAGFAGKYSTWSVGLGLTWTILDGGLRESDLRDAQSKLAEAEAALRGSELRSTEEVRRAALDLDSAVANRAKSEERVELARENYKLVDVNFRAGAATYIEVSDASTQLTSAEIQLINDSINADLAAIRLMKVAGVWRAGM
jgi:outer membrane protein TolC